MFINSFPYFLSLYLLICVWLFWGENFHFIIIILYNCVGLPWWLRRLTTCLQCRRPRFDPWIGRSPGEGNGNLLPYSCLENPMEEETGGLQSIGSQSIAHNWVTFAHMHACTHTHTHTTVYIVATKHILTTWIGYVWFILRWCLNGSFSQLDKRQCWER